MTKSTEAERGAIALRRVHGLTSKAGNQQEKDQAEQDDRSGPNHAPDVKFAF